jgi:CDP-diacylglycerol--glycerol-3-phosphate 3-phosphatidyltransferase
MSEMQEETQRKPKRRSASAGKGNRRPAGASGRRPAEGTRRPAEGARGRAPRKTQGNAGGGRSGGGIWTPANIVTMVRIVFIPLWLLAAELAPASDGTNFAWQAFLVALFYIALSLTDKLDGYLARSRGEVTTFGKFLDPIADKLVVLVALCFLLEQREIGSWVLLIVLAREFLVSGLRMVVASKGVVVAASNLGKWKTAVTMVAICGLLIVRALPAGMLYQGLFVISEILLVAAMLLTAWSGIDYFVKCRDYLLDDEG